MLRLKKRHQEEIKKIPTDLPEYAKRTRAPLDALINDINLKLVSVLSSFDGLNEDYDTLVSCEQEVIEYTKETDIIVEHLFHLMTVIEQSPNRRSSIAAVSFIDTTYQKLTGITQTTRVPFLKVLDFLTETHQYERERPFLEEHYQRVIDCLKRNPINSDEYYGSLASYYELLSRVTGDEKTVRKSLFSANEQLQKVQQTTDANIRRIAKNQYDCVVAMASLHEDYVTPLLEAIETLNSVSDKNDDDSYLEATIFQTLLSDLCEQPPERLNNEDKSLREITGHLLRILNFIHTQLDILSPETTQASIYFVERVYRSITTIEEEEDISNFITVLELLTNIYEQVEFEGLVHLESHYQHAIQCLESAANQHFSYYTPLIKLYRQLNDLTEDKQVKYDSCIKIVENLRRIEPTTDELIRDISTYLHNGAIEGYSLNVDIAVVVGDLVEAITILDTVDEKTDDDFRSQVLSFDVLLDYIELEDFSQKIVHKKQCIDYLKKITDKTSEEIIKIAKIYWELAEHYQSNEQTGTLSEQAWLDAVTVLNDLDLTTEEHKYLLVLGLSKLESYYKGTTAHKDRARQYRAQIIPLLESIEVLEYEELISLVTFYQEIIHEVEVENYVNPESLAITIECCRKGINRLAQISVKNPDDVTILAQLYHEMVSSYPTGSHEHSFYSFAHLFFSPHSDIEPIMKRIRIFEASLFTVANSLRQDFQTFLHILISDPDCILKHGVPEQLKNPAMKQALQKISDGFDPIKAPRSLFSTVGSSPYALISLAQQVMRLDAEVTTLKRELVTTQQASKHGFLLFKEYLMNNLKRSHDATVLIFKD